MLRPCFSLVQDEETKLIQSHRQLTPLLPVWAELEAAHPQAVTTGITRSTNQSQSSEDEEPRRQKQSRLEDRKLGKRKEEEHRANSRHRRHTERRLASLL